MIDYRASEQTEGEALTEAERIPRRYQTALASCSQTLLRAAPTPTQRQELLNQALDFLVDVVGAGRAYVVQEFVDSEEILCLRLLAEACAPGVYSHLEVPTNQRVPWSLLGLDLRGRLTGGQILSGPTEMAFAKNPDLVKIFHNQNSPLLSVLILPLAIDGVFWGFIGFDDVQEPRQWDDEQIALLGTAAEIFTSTLHRWELEDRLREQAAREATLTERQRLAQDLHDVITQTLYGLTLMARTSREALREGNMQTLSESLEGIEENALVAQRDMRVLLYQLGPLALPTQDGLGVVLKDRLRRVERRLGLETELRIDPAITLEADMVEALYYIITEALNNSLQHAAATHVAVSLVRRGDRLAIEVEDNGCGFRSDRVEPGMGLAQIAKRARLLNADLIIDTTPGSGTRIALLLPPEKEGAAGD